MSKKKVFQVKRSSIIRLHLKRIRILRRSSRVIATFCSCRATWWSARSARRCWEARWDGTSSGSPAPPARSSDHFGLLVHCRRWCDSSRWCCSRRRKPRSNGRCRRCRCTSPWQSPMLTVGASSWVGWCSRRSSCHQVPADRRNAPTRTSSRTCWSFPRCCPHCLSRCCRNSRSPLAGTARGDSSHSCRAAAACGSNSGRWCRSSISELVGDRRRILGFEASWAGWWKSEPRSTHSSSGSS